MKRKAEQTATYTEELSEVHDRLRELDKQQERLLQLYLKDFPEPLIKSENEKINKARESLQGRKAEVEARLDAARKAQVDTEGISQAIETMSQP